LWKILGRLIAAACNTALKTVGTRKGMGIDTSVFRISFLFYMRNITKVYTNFGMGDALNTRAFLINYCKQKNIPRNSIKIFTTKHWWMFEGLGFVRDLNRLNFRGLTPFKNFGKFNIPKIYNMEKNDVCIAKNSGIDFSFDFIEFLPEYEKPKINLPEKFITFNTGNGEISTIDLKNQGYVCTKSWPKEYWEKLVSLLNISCVQIGSGPSCDIIKGSTLNLVDSLNIKQSAEVMRKSLFHIDIEGGLVTLAQHIGKKSVVLFGPCAIENQGRTFNLNLRANTCIPCYEWGTHKYALKVHKSQLLCKAHCMTDLKPEYVAEQIYKEGWL